MILIQGFSGKGIVCGIVHLYSCLWLFLTRFYQSCAFWDQFLCIYKWWPYFCLCYIFHGIYRDFSHIVDRPIVRGLFTVVTQIIISPTLLCDLVTDNYNSSLWFKEAYHSASTWRQMLGSWQHGSGATLHYWRFSLWHFLGSRGGCSRQPTWWNLPPGHIIESWPLFFSPLWCLPVV